MLIIRSEGCRLMSWGIFIHTRINMNTPAGLRDAAMASFCFFATRRVSEAVQYSGQRLPKNRMVRLAGLETRRMTMKGWDNGVGFQKVIMRRLRFVLLTLSPIELRFGMCFSLIKTVFCVVLH